MLFRSKVQTLERKAFNLDDEQGGTAAGNALAQIAVRFIEAGQK